MNRAVRRRRARRDGRTILLGADQARGRVRLKTLFGRRRRKRKAPFGRGLRPYLSRTTLLLPTVVLRSAKRPEKDREAISE